MGGILAATFLAIFFVPLFFVFATSLRIRGKSVATTPAPLPPESESARV